MSKPVDTSKMPPEIHLLAEVMNPGGSIEASEAEGQRQLVNSTAIPVTDYRNEDLESLGFELGDVDEADPLFRECKLPAGWSRERSDHSMWSYIADERGFRRIAIFYKAAFYDRNAHLSIEDEPRTKAQDDADAAFRREFCYPHWKGESKQEGDVLVVEAFEVEVGTDGKPVWDQDTREVKRTGKVETRRIAPDGTEKQ